MLNSIRIQYPDGRLAGQTSETHARAMLRSHVARAVGTGRRVRCIQLEDGPRRPVAGTRYSHNRETEFNPGGTWTLKSTPDHLQPLFRAVQTSCLA